MLYNTKKTWYHAKRSCESVAAHLVTITSQEEMVSNSYGVLVYMLFQTFLTQSFGFDTDGQWGDWLGPWIGYTDAGDKGKWHWVTGEIAVTGQVCWIQFYSLVNECAGFRLSQLVPQRA